MFDFLKRVKKGDLIRVLDYPPGIIFDKKFSDDMINRWAEKESHGGRPSPEAQGYISVRYFSTFKALEGCCDRTWCPRYC
ncbi:unnamed protein product [Calypogeia fissa]